MQKTVHIIGAGLAGCEAAYQLLKLNYAVKLYEMKPQVFSPAHKSPNFAELVCSNSLKSNDVTTAGGLLKEELRILDSLLIKTADNNKVPAGGALAVDRELFSQEITNKLKEFKNLQVITGEVKEINVNEPTIIATGPLTSKNLSNALKNLFGEEYFYFFDAIAPIIEHNSIDFSKCFIANRYNKGGTEGDYINCPMNKEEYLAFYNELINAETVQLKDFEKKKVYEGCMAVEILASRGVDALRFGPLKPVGLIDPVTGKEAYATVQLRRETNLNNCYNMVGFQTNLTYKEQKRVFGFIPALKNAEYLRYGTMHKNNYINAPKLLNKHYQLKNHPNIFIAGQLSGVEGYIESISSGLVAAINMHCYLQKKTMVEIPANTITGGLVNYITTAEPKNFQPMGSNMGLIISEELSKGKLNKKDKYTKMAEHAVNKVIELSKKLESDILTKK